MFTIIYDKESGNVQNITSESNGERLKEALPITKDFIFAESLPKVQMYRQQLKVIDGELKVIDKVLSQEEEELVVKMELDDLRGRREQECFAIINRGQLWYGNLTETQLEELKRWYQEWLDVTETKTIPQKPKWII